MVEIDEFGEGRLNIFEAVNKLKIEREKQSKGIKAT